MSNEGHFPEMCNENEMYFLWDSYCIFNHYLDKFRVSKA